MPQRHDNGWKKRREAEHRAQLEHHSDTDALAQDLVRRRLAPRIILDSPHRRELSDLMDHRKR